MATVSAGSSASETLTARSTITISAIDGTERANVVVLRSGAQIFGDRVSMGASLGPFLSGDVVTIAADFGALDYTVSASVNAIPQVAASRNITAADDGLTLECTATVTLTVPADLTAGFGCAIIPSGTTSIASSGGALLNGATSTITRTAASNAMFAIQARASAANSYVVTGA